VLIARRRLMGEVALRSQGEELGARLDALQRELEDERVISRVGENVARLAHGLKNAVHSLRGFVALLEPELGTGPGARAALRGLHAAIDDLEALARLTLADRGQRETEKGGASDSAGERETPARRPPAGAKRATQASASLPLVVEAAHAELVQASPGVDWQVVVASGGQRLDVAIATESLTELLVILMRNAVEAMSGSGHGVVEYGANGDFGVLVVSDEGPGFSPDQLDQIFQPGFTTKTGGSGFGLFLARRIVEDHGGALALERAESGGARVRVELPRVQPEGD
jgi:signal transduction histidine kinase